MASSVPSPSASKLDHTCEDDKVWYEKIRASAKEGLLLINSLISPSLHNFLAGYIQAPKASALVLSAA